MGQAACELATAPDTKPDDMSDSSFRFRIAAACIDRAALTMRDHSAGERFLSTEIVAACAAEIRDHLAADSGDARVIEAHISYSGQTWQLHAVERLKTLRQGVCRRHFSETEAAA